MFIGITPEGRIVGQQVADSTLREVATMLARFEPPALISQERIRLPNGLDVLVLAAPALASSGPFTFEGCAYQRVGSTTSALPQAHYETLLLQRAHGRLRWENTPATGITLKHLDREEILRTVRLGIEAGRMPESSSRNLGDILDRLRLRENGEILNAAVVLFGKASVPGFPQCKVRLARFRRRDKSEFLDNRQPDGHAFALLDEAMMFLHRHLPLSGRFEPGRLERIDELLFPTAALREALVNAFCHRDYAIWGGAVNVAVYDDRLEIWSDGTLPFGIRPDDLKREHASKPRNPFITNVFYRRGLIEQWGRGTNRIVELTLQAGHPAPEFEEIVGSVMVRFRPKTGAIHPGTTTAPVAGKPQPESQLESQLESRLESIPARTLLLLAPGHLGKAEISHKLGQKTVSGQLHKVIRDLSSAGYLEPTIPEKPQSRLQKYRLTDKGRAWLARQSDDAS